MIRIIEINKIAEIFKVPAETIEKDYFISWVLACLSKSPLMQHFIFYGGTAIKRMYFEDHRFSEDIDLISSKKFTLSDISEMMLTSFKYAKSSSNIILEINPNSIIVGKSRIQLSVNYQGFEEITGAPKEILVDFNMDMELYGETIEKKMIETYSDLKNINTNLNVLSLNTILANKLGMLFDLSRNEPRDLFDIWFLLQRQDRFDFNFNEIKNIVKKKYGFNLSINILEPRIKNNLNLKNSWNNRLSKQIAELPCIDRVINDVCKSLNILFRSN